MIAIYLDDVKPGRFYLDKEFILDRIYYFDNLNIPCAIFTDLNKYLDSKISTKVAISFNNFSHGFVTESFEKKFPEILDRSNLVFLVETDYIKDTLLLYQEKDNVIGVFPGLSNNLLLNKKIIFKPTWFEITKSLYIKRPDLLDVLNPCQPKPKYFDILLGTGRPNRDFIYSNVLESNLNDKNIINYHLGTNGSTNFILEPGTVHCESTDPEKMYSNDQVVYFNETTHLGCIIHREIYNQTAYSVVAETHPSNYYHTFSEKLAKPIMGKRLFIVFAGCGYLNALRNAGFRTFNEIIDESYDLEPNEEKRWAMAFDQIKFLCSVDQIDILNNIKDIVDHNFKLLMETDWTKLAIDQMLTNVKNLTDAV
jgi:hypothetical protein